MGNRSPKGSLSPPIIPSNFSANQSSNIQTSFYEDFVVLEQSNSVVELNTKGFALDPISLDLYVCDESAHCIRVFSSNFNRLFSFSGMRNHLHYPRGISIRNNRVFITEHYSSALSVFSLEGDRITKCIFIHTKNTMTNLSFISGLTVDESGDIYICDQSNHRIVVLTHDVCGHYEFARASLTQPLDIKIDRGNIIILDMLSAPKKAMYADGMVLRVYSRQEELLKIIMLDNLILVRFFDVTPKSNYVVSSLNAIKLVSKRGHVLKSFDNKSNFDITFHPGVVVNRQTTEVIGLSNEEGKPITFVKFRINDQS